ncbi:MAG: Ppx/GppA family phosphatase [Paucibacter sp.]|nr:Ppx/GppA family phosphatase [Roseateles sp.]
MPQSATFPASSPTLAAIDLGSNSFRLEIGSLLQGDYLQIHCRKEMVRLGAGLDARGTLSREAMSRGLGCLKRFASDLARLGPDGVRVVATQTLREARNSGEFIRHAEDVLGAPVEVISGQEEARLIYAGVSFLHPSDHRRLVIDIGGRSTEIIVGQARTPHVAESFKVGSASISQRHFPNGRVTVEGFRAAQRAVRAEFGTALASFSPQHWDEAMGSSGTAGAVSTVLRLNGVTDGELTADGLRWLIERCVEAGHIDHLELPGLKDRRRSVLPGGLSILYTFFAHCGVRQLHSTRGALRQGVIVDLHESRLSNGNDHRARGGMKSRAMPESVRA